MAAQAAAQASAQQRPAVDPPRKVDPDRLFAALTNEISQISNRALGDGTLGMVVVTMTTTDGSRSATFEVCRMADPNGDAKANEALERRNSACRLHVAFQLRGYLARLTRGLVEKIEKLNE